MGGSSGYYLAQLSPNSFLVGAYPYTSDLLTLESYQIPTAANLQAPFSSFTTPIHEWEPILRSHPDKLFAQFLERGLTHGFRIGFDRSKPLKPAKQNLSSIRDNPSAVERYINDEVASGKLQPVPRSKAAHISPIGIIPKRNQLGKFCLIVDLSSPSGHSINDGIDPSLCSLKYASVAQAADMVRHLGKGALMAIASA